MSRSQLSKDAIKVAEQRFGSPLYLYNLNKLVSQYRKLQAALPDFFNVHYALKANGSLAISQCLAREGAGADISSVGELAVAMRAGFEPVDILFTGPGKTRAELEAALDAGVGLFVIESLNEAHRLSELARQRGVVARVLVRINPLYRTSQSCEVASQLSTCSVDEAPTPETEIQTIVSQASKFGVDEEMAAEVLEQVGAMASLELRGIHVFTESNVIDYRHLLASWRYALGLAERLRNKGLAISEIDFGGGIGVAYDFSEREFDLDSFAQGLSEMFQSSPCTYQCRVEVGRFIVAESGCYIAEVVDIKTSLGKKFIILDGGIHNLFRVSDSMRAATQYLDNLSRPVCGYQRATLAGKLPSPLDLFVEDVRVPRDVEVGDRLAVYNCGAYGFTHSLSNFCLHPGPAEAAYLDGHLHLIRRRGRVSDIFRDQFEPVAIDLQAGPHDAEARTDRLYSLDRAR